MRAARAAFAFGAIIYLAAVALQVFLAGLAAFELGDWSVHRDLGWLLSSAPSVLVLLALASRADRDTTALAVALLASAFLQPMLAEARGVMPVIAALHPVNAMILAWLAWVVARRAIVLARSGDQSEGVGAGPGLPDRRTGPGAFDG